MFSQTFSNLLASPHSHMLEEYSNSTETPQFSIESESNAELNYTKYINLDESDEEKNSHKSSIQEQLPSKNDFFKPIFSNLQQYVSSQLSQSDYLKLLEKSKRIIKRENAKKRVKMAKMQKNNESIEKQEEENVITKISNKTIEKNNKKGSEIEKPSSEKDMKKVIQKLRNRISAQQSRDRKKVYLENIERENQLLQAELKALKEKKQVEVAKEEKKMNPLGILKLGMAFISLFMIIVTTKNQTNNEYNVLTEINQTQKINEDAINLLEKMSFWKKTEYEEMMMKIDKQNINNVLNQIKLYNFHLIYNLFLNRESLSPDGGWLEEEKVKLLEDFMYS